MKKKIIIGVVIFLVIALCVGSYFIFFNKDDKKTSDNKKSEYITITFDSDGGTKVDDMKVKKGEKFKLPETEKKGYFFQGWYDGKAFYFDEDTDKIDKVLEGWLQYAKTKKTIRKAANRLPPKEKIRP